MSVSEARSDSPPLASSECHPYHSGSSTVLTDKERNLYALIETSENLQKRFKTASLETALSENAQHPKAIQLTKARQKQYTNQAGETRTGLELYTEAKANKVLSNQIKAFGFQRPQFNEIENSNKEFFDHFKKNLSQQIRVTADQIREEWTAYLPNGTERTLLKELVDRKREFDQNFSPFKQPTPQTISIEHTEERKFEDDADFPQ